MQKMNKNIILKVITGALTGIANGLFGGGGGMVLVPLLEMTLKKDEKTAHATCLLIILPVTIISATIYVICKGFNFNVGVPVGIGAIVGGAIGAYALKNMTNIVIIAVFSAVMMIAGVKMVFF